MLSKLNKIFAINTLKSTYKITKVLVNEEVRIKLGTKVLLTMNQYYKPYKNINKAQN